MIRPESLSTKWPQKPLADAVDFLDHLRRPITARDRKAGQYPYYGANGQQDSVADYIFNEPLILLAEDGGYFGDHDRTIAYQIEGKCWVNNHAHVLRPKEGVDIRFLCRQLEKYDVTRFINGATRQKLNKGIASEIPITLPPLPEQKRIAAILDKADAIRRKRQAAIKLADDFLRATFLDMFGDPVTNPRGWKKASLGTLIKVKSGGFLPANKMQEGNIPVYGGNGINGYHNKYMFKRSMLVIGRVGVYCGVVHKTQPKSWVTDNALYVTEKSEAVTDLYLEWSLRMANLNQYASQAGQPLISGGRIYPVKITLPSLGLQQDFEKMHKSHSIMSKRLQAKSGEIDTLFNSLTQRAFRGEL